MVGLQNLRTESNPGLRIIYIILQKHCQIIVQTHIHPHKDRPLEPNMSVCCGIGVVFVCLSVFTMIPWNAISLRFYFMLSKVVTMIVQKSSLFIWWISILNLRTCTDNENFQNKTGKKEEEEQVQPTAKLYKFVQSRAHQVNNKQLSVISGQFKLGNIFSFVLLTNGVSVFCTLGNFFLGSSQSLCYCQPPFHYSVNNIRLCVNRTPNSFLEMGKMQNATKGKNICFSHSSVSICARVRCTQWTNLIYYTFSSFFCVRVCFSAIWSSL